MHPTGPDENSTTGQEERPRSRDAKGASDDQRHVSARRRAGRKRSFWRELPILIGIALVLTILIQTLVARVYVIPSESMETTLHGCDGCENDRVLADKMTYRFSAPKPGDVVIFRGPGTWSNDSDTPATDPITRFFQEATTLVGFQAPDEQDFVKRVIATGGQTVRCCDTGNRVLVDGKPLNEPYIYWEPGRGHRQRSFAPVRIPPGYLWVMGDNRNDSADSRIQGGGGLHGIVPVSNVIGKARFIVLPPARWGMVPDSNPQPH
jgi:signal peptidase I